MNRTVLVVENNAAMRELIFETVSEKGDTFYECVDGAIAVANFKRLNPDVILMDIDLDGMDGLSATRGILKADPSAKIIIVSNYDSSAFRTAAIKAGVKGYVLKENLDSLPNLINTLL